MPEINQQHWVLFATRGRAIYSRQQPTRNLGCEPTAFPFYTIFVCDRRGKQEMEFTEGGEKVAVMKIIPVSEVKRIALALFHNRYLYEDEDQAVTEECDICETQIQPTPAPALCQRCEGPARAHGRLICSNDHFSQEGA